MSQPHPQSMYSTVAVTIRFQEEIINSLKKMARESSYLNSSDVAYTCLIRDAVEKQYFKPKEESVVYRRDAKFWTQEDIEAFNNSPTGQMIAKCIATEDFKELLDFVKTTLIESIENNSLASKLLIKSRNSKNVCEIEQTVKHNSFAGEKKSMAIGSRHPVTEKDATTDGVFFPANTTACHPVLTNGDFLPHKIMDALWKGIIALESSIDNDLMRSLEASNNILNGELLINAPGAGINPACVDYAISNIIKQNGAPGAIVMPFDHYLTLKRHDSKAMNTLCLRDAVEQNNYGTYDGVPIYVRDYPANSTYVVANKQSLGVLFLNDKYSVKYVPQETRMKHGFILSMKAGLCIMEEKSVSKIDCV